VIVGDNTALILNGWETVDGYLGEAHDLHHGQLTWLGRNIPRVFLD